MMIFDMEKKVLFLCTGNSCRSQMAEGFLRYMGGDRFEAYSAGISPTEVNPLSIKVMAEAGVDISAQRSSSADEYLNEKFDYIITVCDNARQTCPSFPGKFKKIHWNIGDPAEATGTVEERLSAFRSARDIIKREVASFLMSA